jgi:hypothetical protein
LNVCIQIANKLGNLKKKSFGGTCHPIFRVEKWAQQESFVGFLLVSLFVLEDGGNILLEMSV